MEPVQVLLAEDTAGDITLTGWRGECRIGEEGRDAARRRTNAVLVKQGQKGAQKAVSLFAWRLFEQAAVGVPPAIPLLDQAALDLDDKDPAGGIGDDKVGLGVTLSRNSDPQRVPGIPPLRKPARHSIVDGHLRMRFRTPWGGCRIQTGFHHTVILSTGLRRTVQDEAGPQPWRGLRE